MMLAVYKIKWKLDCDFVACNNLFLDKHRNCLCSHVWLLVTCDLHVWMLFAEVMYYTIELGLLTSMEGEWLMLMMKNLLIGDWTSLVVDMPDSHDHGVWWVLSSLETRMHPATFLSITGMNTGLHGTSMWPYGISHRVFVIVKLNPHLWRWRWWCHWKNGKLLCVDISAGFWGQRTV